MHAPVLIFQTLIVLSALALAKSHSNGENEMSQITLECPLSVEISSKSVAFQILIVLS